MPHFCGEIIYFSVPGNVQSDICFDCSTHAEDSPLTIAHREFLHKCLDEWLNKSEGTGAFWVGDPEYFNSWNIESGGFKVC